MSTSTSARPRLAAAVPQFSVSDVLATVHYYRDRLGFDVGDHVADPPEWGAVGRDELSSFQPPTDRRFKPLYALEQPLSAKIETIAREIYGADGVDYVGSAAKDIARLEEIGMRDVPVCMAKTQYSFSDNPSLRGRPRGFRIGVREVTPSAGAGFVVAHTGDIMTMPGLPKRPAAEGMKVLPDGSVVGLF